MKITRIIILLLLLQTSLLKSFAQGKSQNEQEICINYVINLIRRAPAFQQQTEGLIERIQNNGGISYGFKVESSPFPDATNAELYSENIEISLHENYPDRMPTIARYLYIIREKKLYQIDNLSGGLILLDLDKSNTYPNACKSSLENKSFKRR